MFNVVVCSKVLIQQKIYVSIFTTFVVLNCRKEYPFSPLNPYCLLIIKEEMYNRQWVNDVNSYRIKILFYGLRKIYNL